MYDNTDDYCQEEPEECPYCNGTGWSRSNDTIAMECPECGGDGYQSS